MRLVQTWKVKGPIQQNNQQQTDEQGKGPLPQQQHGKEVKDDGTTCIMDIMQNIQKSGSQIQTYKSDASKQKTKNREIGNTQETYVVPVKNRFQALHCGDTGKEAGCLLIKGEVVFIGNDIVPMEYKGID